MIIKHDAKALLLHQINSLYDCTGEGIAESINLAYPKVLDRLDKRFSHIKNKYYHSGEENVFNPLHVAQWTMFLYEIAHEISKSSDEDLCDIIYGISKAFSSADIFYGVDMPDIWFFDHPQGSVMGRAKYADYFSFSQGCTVGNNKGAYPILGKHVTMFSNSKILGDCHIGDHVIFSADSYILDADVPSYSIVFGRNPNIIIKSITSQRFNELTGSIFDGDDD